ncbi:MAG: hypothetical protein ACOYOU_11600 [Kiritimatiellia bacterium]
MVLDRRPLVIADVLQEEKMGKKARIKRERRSAQDALSNPFWEDASGIHTSFLVPGEPPPDATERMTAEFQKRIRHSPMWKQMVEQFGEKQAEKLLKECKAEIK